jgi:hypothetical protein
MSGIQDIKLDLTANDIVIEDYDMQIIDEGERIRQQLTTHLLTARGEWYLNINHGVPYFEDIWKKQADRALIESVFKTEIMKIDDILEIISFALELDAVNRSLSVLFSAKTTFGAADNITVEVS